MSKGSRALAASRPLTLVLAVTMRPDALPALGVPHGGAEAMQRQARGVGSGGVSFPPSAPSVREVKAFRARDAPPPSLAVLIQKGVTETAEG